MEKLNDATTRQGVRIAPRFGQRETLFGLGGITIGILVTGLLLPYLVGSRPQTTTTGPGQSSDFTPSGVISDQDIASSTSGTAPAPSTTPSASGLAPAAPSSNGSTPEGSSGPVADAGRVEVATTDPAPPTPGDVELRATDRGVTADAINVGFILSNGTSDSANEEAKERVRRWTDFLNERGGVLGRELVPGFGWHENFNPEATRRSACLAVTEDHESFAVVSPAPYRDPLCVAEEHGALYLTAAGFLTEDYRRAQGRLITFAMDTQRTLRNHVELLHRDGTLKGRTIGVVYDSRTFSKLAVERGLLPQLDALGYEVAATTELSGTDLAQGQAQIPIELAKHQSAGVDVEFMAASVLYFATWSQEGDKQGFRPLYTVTDLSGGSNADFFPGWPSGMRAIGHSSGWGTHEYNAGLPPPPQAEVYAECEVYYEQITGRKLRRPGPDSSPDDQLEYAEEIGVCPRLLFIKAVAEAVGPDLTIAAFSQHVQTMTNLDHWVYPPGSSFGPGKFDSPNHMRKIGWQEPCPNDPDRTKPTGCFVPAGAFEQAPF